jgi:hypothetical protein
MQHIETERPPPPGSGRFGRDLTWFILKNVRVRGEYYGAFVAYVSAPNIFPLGTYSPVLLIRSYICSSQRAC